jgi:hypothetical protein
MRTRYFHPAARVAAAALLAGLIGCGDKGADAVGALNRTNIQRLSNMYAAYQNYKGQGPNEEAEFRDFIAHFQPAKLAMMKIDPNKPDALFTSERDGKPFKVRYNVGGGRGSVDAVVFEQEGQGGKKQVGFTGGKVEEVDDAAYEKLWAGEGPSAVLTGPTAAASAGRAVRPTGPPAGAPTGPPGK